MAYNSYALKSLLQEEHIFSILESLGARGIRKDSNGFRSSCPIHKSNGTTVFVLNPDTKLYCCYGECIDDEKDGDIIKLVECSNKCTFDDAIKFICDISGIDIKTIEDNNEEWLLNQLDNTLNSLLLEDNNNEIIIEDEKFPYGVNPIPEDVAQKFIGQKDEEGYIDSQGFSEATLTLFESGYDSEDKRWLLPQRSPDGILLGFDGRDITNTKKDKWKKRKGLLKNKLLGRLDIVKEYIEKENKVILCEGKKDQMAIFEAGLNYVTCLYGSSMSKEQKLLIDSMIDDEIIIFADGDKAGYKMVKSVVKLCYPEYKITVPEIEDEMDPAELTKDYMLSLYENRIPVEEWLKKYFYRTKIKK